jgi:hypothetical protein
MEWAPVHAVRIKLKIGELFLNVVKRMVVRTWNYRKAISPYSTGLVKVGYKLWWSWFSWQEQDVNYQVVTLKLVRHAVNNWTPIIAAYIYGF